MVSCRQLQGHTVLLLLLVVVGCQLRQVQKGHAAAASAQMAEWHCQEHQPADGTARL
jgi:hypothetical protein